MAEDLKLRQGISARGSDGVQSSSLFLTKRGDAHWLLEGQLTPSSIMWSNALAVRGERPAAGVSRRSLYDAVASFPG